MQIAERSNDKPGYVCVLEPGTGKLLFRFDPIRDIIEIQRRGRKTYVDLYQYRGTAERQGAPDG